MPFSGQSPSQRTGFFLFTTVLMLVCAAYVAWTLLWPLPGPVWPRVLLILVFLLSSQAISLVRYLLSSRPDLPFQNLRFFGFSSSMFMLLVGCGLIRDALWLALALIGALFGQPDLAGFLRAPGVNLGILLLCAVLAALGVLISYRLPVLTRVSVIDANLPPELDGLRLIHATDLHIGANKSRGWAQNCVALINAAQPDLILISGDLADGTPERMAEEILPLASLRSRYGVFACLGNHEYYGGAWPWTKTWQDLGLVVLVNDFHVIEHNGALLAVAGLADTCAGKYGEPEPDPQGVRAALPDAYSVLLSHRPAAVEAHARLGYNVQLSGHTHGGQFPMMFPLVNYLNSNFRKGVYRCGQMWLHVGQGAGFWGYVPMRLLTRPEFVEIVLNTE